MGMDRVEHQLTLGSGGPRSAEMEQMIKLMLDTRCTTMPTCRCTAASICGTHWSEMIVGR